MINASFIHHRGKAIERIAVLISSCGKDVMEDVVRHLVLQSFLPRNSGTLGTRDDVCSSLRKFKVL